MIIEQIITIVLMTLSYFVPRWLTIKISSNLKSFIIKNKQIYSIQQASDGGYIVVGYSLSTDGDVTGHHGSSNFTDFWVVKLDNIGTIQWQKSLGGSQDDYGQDIKQTLDGGYIVVGYSFSDDGDITGHYGNCSTIADYWVVKLDNMGTIQWQKSLGGSSGDAGFSILQNTDGSYVVAGVSSSLDNDVSVNNGAGDFWIVKLAGTTDIQYTSPESLSIIWPNPTYGNMDITLAAINPSEETEIEVINVMGQVILTQKINTLQTHLDISEQPSGVYLICVKKNWHTEVVGKLLKI